MAVTESRDHRRTKQNNYCFPRLLKSEYYLLYYIFKATEQGCQINFERRLQTLMNWPKRRRSTLNTRQCSA